MISLCLTSLEINAFIGFRFSQVFKDRDACIEAAMDTAQLMASKAPTGSKGTKLSMVYSRDHTVSEGLDHVVSIMYQSLDS